MNINARYIVLFIPWIISSLLMEHPVLSYTAAWLGSWWIFYCSMTGKIKPIPKDLGILGQLMRPLFITQFIFAGYLAVSSVFFFLDVNGYYYFSLEPEQDVDPHLVELAAQCQRYYCLAHASFTTGILLAMNYRKQTAYQISVESYSNLLLWLSLGFSVFAFAISIVPGLGQFAIKLRELSFVGAVLSLAFSITKGKIVNVSIAAAIFLINMVSAFLSGWKEQILVPLIMLGAYLYPFYRGAVSVVLPVLLALFFIFIPTYNGIFRKAAWSGETDAESAAKVAIEAIRSGEADLKSNNWAFLTHRLSEISMFVKYVDRVPNESAFYGVTIVKQAVQNMFPRALWPDKPITEELVMKRVYDIGIVDRTSMVSAKPPLITDGYLSGGGAAIFILAFLLGLSASHISILCERLFGGYIFGSALIYTGLFQIFWRGNCFEFMLSSVFWSIVLMYMIFYIGRYFGLIKKSRKPVYESI